jgi:hypothetical protein
MAKTTQFADLQLNGANRGGWGFSEKFFAKADLPSKISSFDQPQLPAKIEIIDPEQGRADKLANFWQKSGVPALARQAKVEEYLEQPTAVRILAVDHPQSLFRVISYQQNEKVLQFGILVAPDSFSWGGRIIGIGGTIVEQDIDSRHWAKILFSKITQLTHDERRTSRMISSRPVDSIQLVPTRLALHHKIASDTHEYLNDKIPDSGLYLTETLSPNPLSSNGPNIYPAKLMQVNGQTSREELNEKALELASSTPLENMAAVFFQKDHPWLHINFLTKKPDWYTRHEVEMPLSEETRNLYREAVARPRVTESDITATD